MSTRYGGSAVIVGASDGIGAAFAYALARQGYDLVLAARRADVLESLARELYGVDVVPVVGDAGTGDGIARILRTTENVDVGLLVVNAALAPVGEFLALAPAQLDAVLDLNCRTAAHLVHAFGTRMVARGRGGIVLLSSMASQQGAALVAHYSATKAYLRVLAEGLYAELGPSHVDVIACCPGLVETPTFARTRPERARFVPPPLTPDEVVRETLAALGRQPMVIPGRRNRMASFLAQRLLPRRSVVRLASARTREMYPTVSNRPAPVDGRDG